MTLSTRFSKHKHAIFDPVCILGDFFKLHKELTCYVDRGKSAGIVFCLLNKEIASVVFRVHLMVYEKTLLYMLSGTDDVALE